MAQEVRLEIEAHKEREGIVVILVWLVPQGLQGLLDQLVQEVKLVVKVNRASRV
jgi:hypothetical protein